jgi:hypothetical protein
MHAVDEQRASDPPGERRLDRPPSERYMGPAPEPTSGGAGSPGRGIAIAVVAALVGGAVITLAGGLLSITAGLLVIAAALGWVVAATLSSSVGGGTGLRREWLAAALAAVGVALGQLGLWLVARQEGGTLGLIDYLWEVFGILVPSQLVLAILVAWWRAR